MKRKWWKGFTIIEMIIVVVVLAIITTWAVRTYTRFIERTRAAEADNTIGLAATAQGRYLMRTGRYTPKWTNLDSPPLAAYLRQVGEYISTDHKYYFTRGGASAEKPKSGFKMYFEDVFGKYFVVAERTDWRYGYFLIRPLPGEKTYCVPMSQKQVDIDFCLDFMNVDSEAELPGDPRLAVY